MMHEVSQSLEGLESYSRQIETQHGQEHVQGEPEEPERTLLPQMPVACQCRSSSREEHMVRY